MSRSSAGAAASIACQAKTIAGLPMSMNAATRFVPGASALRSSSRFASSSLVTTASPVTLAPGRSRLATRPVSTGSSTVAVTTGSAALLAASVAGVPAVTMRSTLARTSSAARAR